jgi:single-strand DNA-binding protein
MSSLNSCSFIGRVGKDVEAKSLESGKPMCVFTLAVSEKYKDKDGESKEETTWVNCVAFSKLSEIIVKYVKKGDLLYINGKLSNRKYEKDGVTKYFTEVVLSDMKMLGTKGHSDESVFTDVEKSKPSKAKVQEPDNDLPF